MKHSAKMLSSLVGKCAMAKFSLLRNSLIHSARKVEANMEIPMEIRNTVMMSKRGSVRL
jgi:hypothetical protein